MRHAQATSRFGEDVEAVELEKELANMEDDAGVSVWWGCSTLATVGAAPGRSSTNSLPSVWRGMAVASCSRPSTVARRQP